MQNLMQSIGLAFLTILIPFAIAILTDILQKKKEENADFAVLDLHVILDFVLKFKLLLLGTSLVFLPSFFWKLRIVSFNTKILIVFLWIDGIILLVKIIFDMYLWTKGNVFEFRVPYLKELNQFKDLGLVWRSVWQTKNINERDEEKFFEIFSSQIDNFLNNAEKKKTNFDLILRLLGDFKSFIGNRHTLILPGTVKPFSKILEWHFKAWIKKYKHLYGEDKLKIEPRYGLVLSILDSVFQIIEETTFKEGHVLWFFYHLKEHLDAYKQEFVENKKKGKVAYYREYLLRRFYNVLFEKTPASALKEHGFWDEFPEEWTIKKSNLENEGNLISRISLNEFLSWAGDRIQLTEETRDKQLDNVSMNLFPEIDPMTWSIILLFIYSGGSVENRMKSAIERPWDFGSVRAVEGWGEENLEEKFEKIREEQEKNTFELALLIFKNQFTKERLEKYIKELKQLVNVYSIGSRKEERRIELLRIFEEMLSLIH